MQTILTILLLGSYLLSNPTVRLPHPAVQADAILGEWTTEGGKSKVLIYKNGTKYFGKITWLKDPKKADGTPKVDEKNPNEKLRARPIIGLLILRNFEFDDDEWTNGKIYDPESGSDYSCTIKMNGNNKLDVRGYVGISLFGRTTYWSR